MSIPVLGFVDGVSLRSRMGGAWGRGLNCVGLCIYACRDKEQLGSCRCHVTVLA